MAEVQILPWYETTLYINIYTIHSFEIIISNAASYIQLNIIIVWPVRRVIMLCLKSAI